MQASLFLAKLIGPILVLVGIGALLNRRSLPVLAEEFLDRPGLFFLTGIIDVSVGLAIVLTHNVWAADWRVIITLIGWLMLIRGTARLLVPEQLKERAAALFKRPNALPASFGVVLLLGFILCYFGYAR